MRNRTLIRFAALCLLLTVLAPASRAEPDDDRVFVTPLVGHITFDATKPWNSIDSTVLYGARVGVRVNRWFGIDTTAGYAFANGNFGYQEDGSGGFESTDNGGKDVDVLYFALDFSFHPMQGRVDPWVSLGWATMRYDYEFDAAGFKDWLTDNGAQIDLGDLSSSSGWQAGLGVAWAFRVTDRSRWSVMADLHDVIVRSTKLEVIGPGGEQLLEPDYGHNFLFNLGVEFAWGSDSDAAANSSGD